MYFFVSLVTITSHNIPVKLWISAHVEAKVSVDKIDGQWLIRTDLLLVLSASV